MSAESIGQPPAPSGTPPDRCPPNRSGSGRAPGSATAQEAAEDLRPRQIGLPAVATGDKRVAQVEACVGPKAIAVVVDASGVPNPTLCVDHDGVGGEACTEGIGQNALGVYEDGEGIAPPALLPPG